MPLTPLPTDHKTFDYSRILDWLYVGTNACCQMHFEKELIEKGVRADISLEQERLDDPTGVEFFLWLPTTDHTPPSMDQLEMGVQSLKHFYENAIPCYAHCKNGHGRAPTLIAAFLMNVKGLTADESIAFLKERRPSIHLDEVQIAALAAYGKKLNG